MKMFRPEPNSKEVNDLPYHQRGSFENIEDGFVRKEVMENERIAELAALLENQERYEAALEEAQEKGENFPKRGPNFTLNENARVSKMDFLESEAIETNNMRNKVIRDLELDSERGNAIELIKKEKAFFCNDKVVMEKAIKIDPSVYLIASEELKEGKEFTTTAIEGDGENILYAPNKFKEDNDLVNIAAKTMRNPECLFKDSHIRSNFSNDSEVILNLIRRKGRSDFHTDGTGNTNINDITRFIGRRLLDKIKEKRQKI